MTKKYQKQQGFTLIEVLVSLVVLAVAFVGIATLQAVLLRTNTDSYFRSVANILALDMVERIYANTPAVEAGSYNNAAGNEAANPECVGEDEDGDEQDESCTPAELALHDFYEWNSLIGGRAATDWHPAITAQLPSGSGVVCIDSTPDDGVPGAVACDGITPVGSPTIYAIKIWWYERTDASSHRYVETVQAL